MSARGARSRKVQQKNIEKTEKKSIKTKGKVPEADYDSADVFAQWRTSPSVNDSRNGITRSLTVSSNNSRAMSQNSSTHDGRLGRSLLDTVQPSNSPGSRQGPGHVPASVSDVSSMGKENATFRANDKETKAPRGRGGGVPPKKTVAASPTFRAESSASHSQPTQDPWANFKIWDGGRDGMRSYSGFSLDHDMQRGEVLIHLGEQKIHDDHPVPTIRAELQVLESSGSTWLTNTLAMGRIEDDYINDWELPNISDSWIQHKHASTTFDPPKQPKTRGPTTPGGVSLPPFAIDQTYGDLDSRTTSRTQHLSETARTARSNSPAPSESSDDQMTTHQIWFPAPSAIETVHGQRLHHVAIRNFLAILHGRPIVGADLFEMLDTLQAVITVMYDLDSENQSGQASQEQSVQIITRYLKQHGLEDVRNDLRRALGLLLWSEQVNVRWRQGYLESFAHLAGVMTTEIEEYSDFKRLSVVTRRNLGLAGKTLQLRVLVAEERLSSFDFADLWDDNPRITNSPVHQHYQLFRQFLISHYQRMHGNWPPVSGKTWLNRKVIQSMQDDFGSLYDYLVDRDVFWNPREERASRKWEMAHRKMDGFKADLPELAVTDVLVMFDAKQGYAHIPHPYPLLPREVPKAGKEKEKEKKSFFSSLKKDKTKDTTRDAKAHLQLSIVFSDATNIQKLEANFSGSTLIDKFEQFELTTNLKHATPREARLGRWVLLYGILQVLSTLSVDIQGLKHTDGVSYLLCTDLKRIPEWVTNGQPEHLEARQQLSWCWQRSWDSKPTQTALVELEAPLPFGRNSAASRQEEFRRAEYLAYSFPSPPPQGALPAPPAFDGAMTMAHDMRRIGEKIDYLSLSHNAAKITGQNMQRRHDNEMSMQSTTTLRLPSSRMESLPQHIHHHIPPPRSASRTTNNHNMETHPYHHQQQTHHSHKLALERQLRSGSISPNTDLATYPFSQNEMSYPVPPRYYESEETVGREEWGDGLCGPYDDGGGDGNSEPRGEIGSRAAWETHKGDRDHRFRESTVLGGGFEESNWKT